MGMFSKTADAEQQMKQVEGEAISSIIDKSMTITGEISFKGKARIDGTINGNIEGEHLILSETGKVTGDLSVSSLNCYGSVEGNIKADMLIARKQCSMVGKFVVGSLTVEPGAAIEGEIKAAVQGNNLSAKLLATTSDKSEPE
ncbi:bactofilin family protein [Desulforhopalus singaporensis]|uniref:Protein CcmA, bactofilin family n=1 Tax=Desulforhopalus singaporensis TaxID=91360 RepID=A0A1H0K3C6_9BACT|nr:polymer-forming cytoskeletal protein [Desulforhopalus singaporensis]SDO50399.1 protein CcmA, bactofilin family [Desulforhopalus singaporensis]